MAPNVNSASVEQLPMSCHWGGSAAFVENQIFKGLQWQPLVLDCLDLDPQVPILLAV